MKNFKKWPLLIAFGLAFLGVLVFSWFVNWGALTHCFKDVKVADLPSTLAPLAFAAAFIERAVEILISPWRDEGFKKLQKALAAVQARPVDPAAGVVNAKDLQTASDALDEYQGDTQRLAFAVSITLSALVAMTGFPSLGLFVDASKCVWLAPTYHSHQAQFLHSVDLILSTALLAGGADGVHSVVNAVTSFFQATAEKAKP